MQCSSLDIHYMTRAIALARNGWGRVSPNPPVGCVIVSEDVVVGEGWHQRFGGAHAEVNALHDAGVRANGATAYVTLMPCDHSGKTPPCTRALIAAGVARVVVAVDDPDPVSGSGAETLRAAGIACDIGCCGEAAAYGMRGFLKQIATGLPFLTLKYAMTLDGKTATRTGDSQWISCETSRAHVQAMRAAHDAVLVGAGTAVQDNPRLNVRTAESPQPYRVVVDSTARLSPEAKLFQEHGGAVLLLTTSHAPEERIALLQAAGAAVHVCPATETGRVDVAAALRLLADLGIRMVLCEGGAGLAASLVEAGLVDELVSFVAPKLAGGTGPGGLSGVGVAAMQDALPLSVSHVERSGVDVMITARVGDWAWMSSAV